MGIMEYNRLIQLICNGLRHNTKDILNRKSLFFFEHEGGVKSIRGTQVTLFFLYLFISVRVLFCPILSYPIYCAVIVIVISTFQWSC